jgi:hypothetical protein
MGLPSLHEPAPPNQAGQDIRALIPAIEFSLRRALGGLTVPLAGSSPRRPVTCVRGSVVFGDSSLGENGEGFQLTISRSRCLLVCLLKHY